MSEHGEDRFVKAILVIRDGLTEVVKRLKRHREGACTTRSQG